MSVGQITNVNVLAEKASFFDGNAAYAGNTGIPANVDVITYNNLRLIAFACVALYSAEPAVLVYSRPVTQMNESAALNSARSVNVRALARRNSYWRVVEDVLRVFKKRSLNTHG